MKNSLKDESLEYQTLDFSNHVYAMIEAVTKADAKCRGFEIPISKEIESAIKKDVLKMGIKLGIYAPELKDYLQYVVGEIIYF